MELQENYSKTTCTYRWVDVFKFFFCICIIAMHSNIPFPGNYWTEKLVFRLGVPFFFVASGYFLSMSCGTRGTEVAVKRYCLRLLELLAAFSAIWIPQFWIDCAISKIGTVGALVSTLQHILFFPNNALWYIQASVVGALLLAPFIRKHYTRMAILIGLVLYGFALLCNNYFFLIQNTAVRSVIDTYTKICLAPHNGVFVGFLYLALGVYTHKYLSSQPVALLWRLLGICYALYIAEVLLISKTTTQVDDGAFYVMQIAVAPLLLSILLRVPDHFDSSKTILMRRLSTGMYLLHLPLMWCYHRFCDYILPNIPVLRRATGILWNGYVKFALILFCSWAICMLAYRYTKTIKRFLM